MEDLPEESQRLGIPEERPRISTAAIFVGVTIVAVVFASFAASIGAPSFIIIMAFVMPFFWVANILIRRGIEEERKAKERRAAYEEREQLKEEVAQSVRTSMKGAIKVRCRYCGALSDVHDEKCESCGAPL